MNLPNKLTLSRIALTAVFIFFLLVHGAVYKILALIIFVIAAFTDFLDGYLAKKYSMTSDFGRLMDPIADKVLVISAFLAFAHMELIPAWMVMIIILREFIVTGLRLMALRNNKVIAASSAGKHKTVSQLAAIFIILLFIAIREFNPSLEFWGASFRGYFETSIFYVMLLTVVLTVASGVLIFMRGMGAIYEKKLIKLIATFFYAGYLPIAPGTWGSLAGVLVYFLVRQNIYLSLAVFTALFILGLVAAKNAEDMFGKRDDGRIVIDEVCGILLLFLLIPPYKNHLIAGFILFRLFDIIKLPPTKKLESLPRSWGIMADDLLAALYSYAVISMAVRFF